VSASLVRIGMIYERKEMSRNEISHDRDGGGEKGLFRGIIKGMVWNVSVFTSHAPFWPPCRLCRSLLGLLVDEWSN
jgi:hypothetical protein